MTLDLPHMSPRLRQRARDETCRILQWIDGARVKDIEPFLIGRGQVAKVSVHIDLALSSRESLRRLRMYVGDPMDADLLRQVILEVFGDRAHNAVALESRVYICFMTEILARRHLNGRPFYTTPDTVLASLLEPDLTPLNVGWRVAGEKDPDLSIRRYFEVLHAWWEMQHRQEEGHHATMDRLRAQTESGKPLFHPATKKRLRIKKV